jgi:hypothetical protein
MMIQDEDKFKNMAGDEVKEIVQASMQGLSQVKQEKQKEIVSSLRAVIETEQVAIEVVSNFEKMLEQNGTELPDDIDDFCEEARLFSRELSKKLNNKLIMEELEKELENSNKLKVYTSKMMKLKNMVEKGREWIDEAMVASDSQVQMTELTRLLAEARKINIEFDLFEELRQRHSEASNLISQSESTTTISESRKTRSKQKRASKKKITKDEAQEILLKLENLKVLSPKIDILKNHIDMISEWENQSSLLISKQSDEIDLESLESLISQSKSFKYIVKLVSQVQDKLDMLEWKDDVAQTLKELNEQTDKNTDVKMEEGVSASPSKARNSKTGVSLEDINNLISDGEHKGFGDSREMNELKELVTKVNKYKLKALEIFEIIDSEDSEESEIDDSKNSQSESNIISKTGNIINYLLYRIKQAPV